MTEYDRDVIAGESLLLDASVRACESDPENPAIALQERIFSASVNRDDAATLALSCFDGPVPTRMEFSAIPMTAPIVRAMVNRFCDQNKLSDDQRFALTSAIGEAVANAVEHAYRAEDNGSFEIRLSAEKDCIAVQVQDHGQWRSFERRDDRGRGMLLMHELMDRVRINSSQQGTCLVTVLNLRRATLVRPRRGRNTRALIPPKPDEFDNTTRAFVSILSREHHTGHSSSSCSKFTAPGMSPSRMLIAEIAISHAPVAPSA